MTWIRWRFLLFGLFFPLIVIVVVAWLPRLQNARAEWTTSRLHGSPHGNCSYRLVDASEIELKEPLAIKSLPGSNDFLVVQRNGELVLVKTATTPWTTVPLADLGDAAFELEIAEDFKQSGHVYVCVGQLTESDARMQIQRIRIDLQAEGHVDPDRIVIGEYPLRDLNGHVGGGMAIDRTGILYVGTGDTGDSSGEGIGYEVSQNVNDRRGKILRFDTRQVDFRPSDASPFARSEAEIHAIGMRNPWKLLFDHQRSRLLAFDVGEDLWESIHIIQPGSNCGWPILEGSHPFRASQETDLSKFQAPFVEHPHSDCRAIVGGAIYQGSAFPLLKGKIVYGDYASGAVFAADDDGKSEMIALSGRQITDIEGGNSSGELIFLSQDGKLSRLQRRLEDDLDQTPKRLSETGLFASAADYSPAAGVIDYEVNSPLFSDSMAKRRHFALPPGGSIHFSPQQPWKFPPQTVLVKTFIDDSIVPARRLETRLLHYAEGRWIGSSYRWNDEQTDADLVPPLGAIVRYSDHSGHEKVWEIPSQMQCMMCHTLGAHFVLGVNTAQLNRTVSHNGSPVSQLTLFESLGVFAQKLPRVYRMRGLISNLDVNSFPRNETPGSNGPIEQQAIAYLTANCSHCHRNLGGGNSRFHLTPGTSPENWGVTDTKPIHGTLGIENAKLIASGHPERSVLLERMRRLDRFHMPKLGTTTVDSIGVQTVERWIRSIPTKAESIRDMASSR